MSEATLTEGLGVALNSTGEGYNISSIRDGNSSSFDLNYYLRKNLGDRYINTEAVIGLTFLYCLIFVTGVVGNMCTCFVISRNKKMHTATNYYLFSLAISDVVTLILALPPDIYTIWEAYPWRFGEVFCIVKSFVSEMTSYASVLTITAFTIERYVAICHPILAHTLSNLSRAVKIIMTLWLLACMFALPYPIHTRVFYILYYPDTEKPITESLMCNIPMEFRSGMLFMFQISSFLFFIVPMTIITVMYVLIGIALKKSEMIGRKTNSVGAVASANARRAVLKMLVAVVIAFFVCWAPFHAQRLMTTYIKPEDWTDELLQIQTQIFYISGVLYFTSSTVNPFLYNAMSRRFRQAFKMTLCRCLASANDLDRDSSMGHSLGSTNRTGTTGYTSTKCTLYKDRCRVSRTNQFPLQNSSV